MRPIVTDRIAWSVGRSVCHTSEPRKNGWTDRDAVWVEDSGGGPDPPLEGATFSGNMQMPNADALRLRDVATTTIF